MLSIITAIYNLFPMNRLFFEYLNKYTYHPFELVIIDNGSTDGSVEFFEGKGAKIIRNDGNYSYPVCQNRGIKQASYENLIFLNNDILVSPNWDYHALIIMDQHDLEIASCCATDRRESNRATKKSQRLWRYIKNPLLFFFGCRYHNLKVMHFLMYGNWKQWNRQRRLKFGNSVGEGIAGSNVIVKRPALEKVGLWDERIQSADFDILIRVKKRALNINDIKPIHLLHGIYLHHYIRLTCRSKYPPFIDKDNIIQLNQKWDPEQINPIIASCDMKIKSQSK